MRISSIVRRIEQISYVYKTFHELSPYMQRGQYCLQDNMRSLIRKEDVNKYSIYFRKEPKGKCDRLLIRLLNTGAIFTANGKYVPCDEMYGALYIANNYDEIREVKLLDVVNEKVKVFFVDKKSKEEFIELNYYLSEICHMPKIHSKKERNNGLTLSLIKRMNFPKESGAIEDICNTHVRMLYNVGKCPVFEKRYCGTYASKARIGAEAKELIEELLQHIPQKLCDIQYTTCLQHGDLSADNMIYGKADGYEGYWWIDWEHLQERVFFYDVFFYIINTAVMDQNYVPTEEFLAGCYDKCLMKLFETAGHEYVAVERKQLFLLFVIDFIKERLGKSGHQKAVAQYREYLEKYFL